MEEMNETNEVSNIDHNLYLSSYEAAYNHKTIDLLQIKRIVTLDATPVSPQRQGVTYLFFKVRDNPSEDLLSLFEQCYRFISEGVAKGDNVLVHCVAGVSRSASIVISYLMVKNSMSFEEAMEMVRKKRLFIEPNDGFQRQLRIFERMNYKLDPMNGQYRQFLVDNLRYKMFWLKPWTDPFYPFPNTAKYEKSCEPLNQFFQQLKDLMSQMDCNQRQEDIYKCKKCRHSLFNEINVLKNANQSEPNVCHSIYVEPLEWMTAHIGRPEKGLINCPNCSAKLGNFNWNQIYCECLLHKDLIKCLIIKIDAKKVDSPLNSSFVE